MSRLTAVSPDERAASSGGTRGPGRHDAGSPHVHAGGVRRPPALPTWSLKVVMAVTGALFTLFVLVHSLGNLKVFTGAEHFNDYAHWLRTVLEPVLPRTGVLWLLRAVLVVCLVAHVGAAALLWRRARVARGPHRRRGTGIRSFTARTMPVTGVVLLCFVVFHVLDLTLGTPVAASAGFRAGTADQAYAYENLVASFQRPAAAAFYVVAMLALFLHVAHGLRMVVVDLGGTGRRTTAAGAAVAGVAALSVLLGNALIPVAVLTGVLA